MARTREQLIADMQLQQLRSCIAQIDAIKQDLKTAEDVSAFLTGVLHIDEHRLTFLNALGEEFLRGTISEADADNDYLRLFRSVSAQHQQTVATLMGISDEGYQRLSQQLQIITLATEEDSNAALIGAGAAEGEEAKAEEADPILASTFSHILTHWHTAEPVDTPQWLEQLRNAFDGLMATAQGDADVQARNLAAIFNAQHANFHPYQLLSPLHREPALPNFTTWLEEGGNALALARHLQNKQLAVLSSDANDRPSEETVNAFLALSLDEQQRMLRNFPTRMRSILRDACWRSTSLQRSSHDSSYFAERHLRPEDNRYDTILSGIALDSIINGLRGTLRTRYGNYYTGTDYMRDYLGRRNYLSAQHWLRIAFVVKGAQMPHQNITGTGLRRFAAGDNEALRTARFGQANTEAYFENLREFLNEFDETPQHQNYTPRHVALNYLIENGYLYTKHACLINSQQLQALLVLISNERNQREDCLFYIISDLFNKDNTIPSEQMILPSSANLRELLASDYWHQMPIEGYKIISAIALHNTTHPEDPIELTLDTIRLATNHIPQHRNTRDEQEKDRRCIEQLFHAMPATQWPEIMRLPSVRSYLLPDEDYPRARYELYPVSTAELDNPRFSDNDATIAAKQAWYMHCYTMMQTEHTEGDSQTAKQQLERAEDSSALIAILREQLKSETGANKAIAEEIRTQLKSYTPFFLQHPESLLMYLRYQFARVLVQQPINYTTGLLTKEHHSGPATINSKLTALLSIMLTRMEALGTQAPNTTQEGIEQHQAICDATHETQMAIPRTLLDPLAAPYVIDNTRLQLCLRYISGEDPERQPVQAQAVAFDPGMAASAAALPAFSAATAAPVTGYAVASGPGVAAPGSALAATASATPMSAAAPPPAGKR